MSAGGESVGDSGGGSGLSRRGWIVVAVVVVVLAVIAVAIYLLVRDTKPSPEAAAWASSVCTSVSTWETQTKTIATDFSGTPTKAGFNDKIAQIETATTTMVNDIKAAPLPTTSDSASAQQQIETLAQDAQATATKIRTQAQSLTGNGATGFVTGTAYRGRDEDAHRRSEGDRQQSQRSWLRSRQGDRSRQDLPFACLNGR